MLVLGMILAVVVAACAEVGVVANKMNIAQACSQFEENVVSIDKERQLLAFGMSAAAFSIFTAFCWYFP